MDLDGLHRVGLIAGMFLLGVSLGAYLIGIQVEAAIECTSIAGAVVGEPCQTLQWGSQLSYWTAIAGSVGLGGALLGEWQQEGST